MRIVDITPLIKAFYDECENTYCRDCPIQVRGCEDMMQILTGLPPIEEQKGKWKVTSLYIKCSECGESFPIIPQNFCPNCGARMEGIDETD